MAATTRQLAVEIGRRLRAARNRAGLKQRDVSRLIPGLEVTRLSNYETGLRVLDIEIAKQIAAIYGVTAAYLLTLEDFPDDPRTARLKGFFALADERGKEAILRLAEHEADHSQRRYGTTSIASNSQIHEP